MASKGETVKYYIDADTSGFARGMVEADAESAIAGRNINRNLSKTAKSSENNFKDIRNGAQRTATQIRSFGTALQGFNTTSAIIGITALSGAVLELSGAVAAAGSTVSIFLPALTGAVAGIETVKVGISGLSAAFKALSKNDPKAWATALAGLGPAATAVAKASGAIFNAFKDIKLNVQQSLWAGLGDTILNLGATVLPVINNGMQEVAQSMNGALKSAAALASTPLFRGLLATIFQDTARNVGVLSQALGPILSIFTSLYAVTRPYVTLLANSFVTLTKTAAAYLGSAKGQSALNLSIQEGLIALKELGNFVGAVFGLLVSIFRTSVNSGNSLIVTLTGIITKTENWVNSAKGQKDLASLFNFTSLALKNVARSIGIAANLFFGIINAIDSLSPTVQTLVIEFLSLALAISPIGSYFLKLFGAIKLVGVVIFNLAQQMFVVFGALGAVASIALVLAGGLIILGSIIRGPLGGALIVVGSLIAAYIGIAFIMAGANVAAAGSMFELGFASIAAAGEEAELAEISVLAASTMYAVAAAGLEAGEGLAAGASGAELLQAALVPLLVLAAGVLVILSLLGVFGSKTKKAQSATAGFGDALGGLQKALKGVSSGAASTSNNGLSALNDSLGQTADSADAASGSLAGFDKMNVLADNNAAGAGIPGIPKLPDLGGAGGFSPTIDTSAFDKAIDAMSKNFDGLQKQVAKPIANPFQSLADWIHSNPLIVLAAIAAIIIIIAAAFVIFGAGVFVVLSPLTLIVLAIVAIIAIIVILVQNWSTIWAAIQAGASATWQFLQNVWDAIVSGVEAAVGFVGGLFSDLWTGIKAVWSVVIAFFVNIFQSIRDALTVYIAIWGAIFSVAWDAIKAVWSAAGAFFSGVWGAIQTAFSAVVGFFGSIFSNAWTAIKNAFGAVTSFFSGIWNTIVNLFTSIGTAVGDAIGGAFKAVINDVLSGVQTVINAPINTINSLIKKINSIPGIPNLPTISTVTLPRLAKGGLVTSPTIAELGEAGTEAVMPLENNTGWIDQLANKINAAGGKNSNQPLNVTLELDGTKLGQIVIDRINEKTQMSGRNTILV